MSLLICFLFFNYKEGLGLLFREHSSQSQRNNIQRNDHKTEDGSNNHDQAPKMGTRISIPISYSSHSDNGKPPSICQVVEIQTAGVLALKRSLETADCVADA